MIEIYKKDESNSSDAILYLTSKKNYKNIEFSDQEFKYIDQEIENKQKIITIRQLDKTTIIYVDNKSNSDNKAKEEFRKIAFGLFEQIKNTRIKTLFIDDRLDNTDKTYAFLEGFLLSDYQFLKYFSSADKKKNKIEKVIVKSNNISEEKISELKIITEGVFYARDMVNEPISYLTATKMSEEIISLGQKSGFSVEVLDKLQLQSLKMGGLLAVNKGSIDPPTFSILEWKPENCINKQAIVFVGKGVVYDTGGLSLKPTAGSMDIMKSDMGGAAAVVGAMYCIAKAKLPYHVIALVPATDNRPGGNAYAPGDVVKMFDGTSIEVLNTDAEGRMILADALSYAKKYKPEFVVDVATLTGSAVMALGHFASVIVGNNKGQNNIDKLINSGYASNEKLVQFPFWDDFAELLKSDIADMKNIGSREAGAITAGKFLEHFTDFPWAHIDIAGPAFISQKQEYRGKGATGVGVRLLFDFVKNYQGK